MSDKKIQARIAHQTPGRVRLQIPARRGDAAWFAELETLLSDTQLFRSVSANARTGSVTLQLNMPAAESLRQLAGVLPFELELTPAAAPPKLRKTGANGVIRLVSGRDLNPMFMAGAVFVAVGAVQAMRGRIMLPALSAFWYAAGAFRLSRKRGTAGTSGMSD